MRPIRRILCGHVLIGWRRADRENDRDDPDRNEHVSCRNTKLKFSRDRYFVTPPESPILRSTYTLTRFGCG
jgi:hypothetical protein